MKRIAAWHRRHYWFEVLFLLFVAMRLLALLLFRPGGFFADNSDYDFYQLWGQMVPSGYTTFQNLWTAYPPLFPALMLPIFELASRVPPWVEPRLAFHVLFGAFLLLFEAGNLILIYRLGNRLTPGEPVEPQGTLPCSPALGPFSSSLPSGLLPATLYALLFAPLYTLLGWFEAMPLFFFLLGIDLLLVSRSWGWLGSAVAAALGFLIKLTPVLLVPIAIRWLGARLSLASLQHEWFRRSAPGNLLRPVIYVLVFAAVSIGVGWAAMGPGFAPQLALSSFRINAIRPPWQSLWAILDGYYGYGLVPIDMRNLQGLARGDQWQTQLPWGLIGIVFVAIYLWLYTRRYDWSSPRTPIAFAGISVVWLFLYSKGWSPQFVVWILAFIVLLNPSLQGIVLAIALTAINFVESTLFLLMLPQEHWLLIGTVLARTLLLILLAAEWLGQIWPVAPRGRRLQRWASVGMGIVIGVTLLASLVGTPRAAQAYWERRSAEHPCREAISLLQGQMSTQPATIVTPQIDLWRDLYPWLRNDYAIRVLDGYDPNDRPVVEVMGEKLAALAHEGEFWWVERLEAGQAGWSPVLTSYSQQPGVSILDEQRLGDCHLARVVTLPPKAVLATVDAAGSPITLVSANTGDTQGSGIVPLVLYWRADGQVTGNYTVFTQLFDANGRLLAQQDNLPVQGLAPTNTWQPGTLIRDEYQLKLPADVMPGAYSLQVGMYDAQGRRNLTIADTGAVADHITLPVRVE